MTSPKPLLILALICLAFSPASAEEKKEGFTLKETPGQYLDILDHGKIVGRYMTAHDVSTPEKRFETFKPYLHIFDPQGDAPITKGAGGLFPHHRAIFIGWDKVTVGGKIYDLWHMKDGDQIHQQFSQLKIAPDTASFTSEVDWNAFDQTTLIAEERTFTFMTPPAFAYAEVDMVSKLKAMVGDTLLDGEVEHAGIHFRPADGVDAKSTVYVFPKTNADPHKDTDYPWVGESFTVGGKRYSVVYLNHPSNPRNTAFSAYRDYGRFGAFFKTTIPGSKTISLHVRFLICEGEMPLTKQIQRAYNDFAGTTDPVPKVTIQKAQPMDEPLSSMPSAYAPLPTNKEPPSVTPTPAHP